MLLFLLRIIFSHYVSKFILILFIIATVGIFLIPLIQFFIEVILDLLVILLVNRMIQSTVKMLKLHTLWLKPVMIGFCRKYVKCYIPFFFF